MASLILVLSVFILGAGAVLGGYLAVTRLPGYLLQRRMDNRIGEVTRIDVPPEENETGGLLKDHRDGPLPSIDRLAKASLRGSAMTAWVEQSGVRITISALLIVAIGCAVAVGMVAAMLFHSRIGWIIGAPIGAAIPFVYLKVKRTRRLRAFEEAFPEALDLMSRALKAGHAFATGLKMVADEMAEPVGPEFRKTFDEQNFGLPLKDALANLTTRIPLLDMRFFSTAVLIQRETGGNLSEILENLAHVVRERFKILRQVRVYTAHGRLTGYVLLALPVFLSIALAFINPEHMQLLFREHIGHMLLEAAVVMQIAGYFWIRHVVKIEV